MYKNSKAIITLLFVLIANFISAQFWADIKFSYNNDPNSTPPKVLFSENAGSKLYVGGNFINFNSFVTHGVITYDPINGWQQFGTVIGNVLDIKKFSNDIYVATQDGVLKWNTTTAKWDTIGVNDVGAIDALHIFNNELYAGGVYNNIDTTVSHGLTKWDGTSWKQVGNFKKICHGTVYSINDYNGELYVFGQFVDTLGVPMNVAKFNGTTWSRITNLFTGGGDEITTSAVYNNELYVGGLFGKYQGSAFNFIAKYNGSIWSDVGSNGLTHSGNSNGQVDKLKVIDNKLFAVGVFDHADNVDAQYIASWDGGKWCGYGNGFDNGITDIVKANDTIFIGGGFWTYNADSILRVAKWIGGNFVDTCALSVGVKEVKKELNLSIYPNPTSSILNITDEQNELQNASIEINNSIGQTVLQLFFNNNIDVGGLTKGYYFITVTTEKKEVLHNKFIKE